MTGLVRVNSTRNMMMCPLSVVNESNLRFCFGHSVLQRKRCAKVWLLDMPSLSRIWPRAVRLQGVGMYHELLYFFWLVLPKVVESGPLKCPSFAPLLSIESMMNLFHT